MMAGIAFEGRMVENAVTMRTALPLAFAFAPHHRLLSWLGVGVVLSAALALGCSPVASQPETAEPSDAPLIIAHRGQSGYLPEHTLPAYAFAYAAGADAIEPDLVMTRDGTLIALHDIHLEGTTNVEQRFPDRKRDDGRFYAADFDLAEIRTLSVHERQNALGKQVFPERFQAPGDGVSGFTVPTFEEVMRLITNLNRETGCRVSVYPETKDPQFHQEHGLDIDKAVLETLGAFGYRGPDDPVFIQSFDPRNLVRMRRELGTELKLVQLIGEGDLADRLTADEGLDRLAQTVSGIGPSKRLIEDEAGQPVPGDLVKRAQARGLVVHPYTFRADVLTRGDADFGAELERFIKTYGVDGLFADHPDQAIRHLTEAGLRKPRVCS